MPVGLTIGTERANALQQSIQDELTQRGYSQDADPVMAEYITIMLINNKTPAQITGELEDLIGSDYDPSFTDWLFTEVAKGTSDSPSDSTTLSEPSQPPTEPERPREVAPASSDSSRRPPHGSRSGVYQHAISQALPSGSVSGQKRTASARSPSPGPPAKSRRTDLPTGPRAMLRDGNAPPPNPRSLLDRVGGPVVVPGKSHGHDDIQARIDSIVNNTPDQNMMMNPPFNPMEMNPMGMANPLLLQEMMMNQMALMAQMASSMGMAPQFGSGFPMQPPMQPDMNMFTGGPFPPVQGPVAGHSGSGNGRGRGNSRGRGGRGRGGNMAGRVADVPLESIDVAATQAVVQEAPIPPVVAPAPIPMSIPQARPSYSVPDRPQSPTLCKYGLKCTNPQCRWSHPSPVATAESGVVLSNEACDKGRDCKDKDCIKAHVSPAVLNPSAEPSISAPPTHTPAIPCRFGVACTRPNCTFGHPPRPQFTSCRFGAACTRATCSFQHPEGRVLPTTFHRGLSTSSPMVNIHTPEAGTMGPSHHRSVTFNHATTTKEKLEKQVRELEEKKLQAEKAVKAAEAASKKDGTKSVAITA